MKTFTAAVVQTASVAFDPKRTIEKLGDFTANAASKGAQLVVFPEAFVGGYPKGLDFGARIGSRSATGRDSFKTYYEGAIDVPGEHTRRLGEIAGGHGLHLVTGAIERDHGTLYCTVLFFGPDGNLLGKHRKLMPTAAERLVWGFGDGSTLPAYDTPLGTLGAVICWENYMPMLRMAMYAKGVTLYCAPTADDRETWVATMRHVALEGRCFVLSACQHIRRDAYPDDYECVLGDAPDTVLIRGGSLIVSPLGEVLAGPNYQGETILYADIDLDDIVRGKYDFDVAGHYARPDVFRLDVDAAEKPAVASS